MAKKKKILETRKIQKTKAYFNLVLQKVWSNVSVVPSHTLTNQIKYPTPVRNVCVRVHRVFNLNIHYNESHDI